MARPGPSSLTPRIRGWSQTRRSTSTRISRRPTVSQSKRFETRRGPRSTDSDREVWASWKKRYGGSSRTSTTRSRGSARRTRKDPKISCGRSWPSETGDSRRRSNGSIRKRRPPSVRCAPGSRRAPGSAWSSTEVLSPTSTWTRGPVGSGGWCVGFATERRDRGPSRPRASHGVAGAQLPERSPLHLEAIRGRVLLDEERRPVDLRCDPLEDPRRDLEPLPAVIEAHEVSRDPIRPLEVVHQRLEVGALENPFEEGPIRRDHVPGPRNVPRAPLEPGPQLPPVLVSARAVVDRRLPTPFQDPEGDGVRPLHAVGQLVLHFVPVDFHPREVRFGELHLVQIHESEAFRPGPFDESDQVRLSLRDERDLNPDRQAEGSREARRGDERTAGGAGPESRRHVEPNLVQSGPRESANLRRVRGHRVQVRVEGRAELTLQELDVVARPLDRVEGVAARDSGARRPDCSGFLQDVLVPRDALLVREDDVLVHLLVRDGAVEAVERADARDKEDHLRSVRALTASDRELAAGGPTERALLEAHGSTNRAGDIKVRGRRAEREPRSKSGRRSGVPLSRGILLRAPQASGGGCANGLSPESRTPKSKSPGGDSRIPIGVGRCPKP